MGKVLFGVDVGGTTVKLGLFDAEGNVLDKWEIPTRTEDKGSHIIEDIAGSILVKMKQEDISKEDVIGRWHGWRSCSSYSAEEERRSLIANK